MPPPPRSKEPPRAVDFDVPEESHQALADRLNITLVHATQMAAALQRVWERMRGEFGFLTVDDVAVLTRRTVPQTMDDADTGHTLAVNVNDHLVWPGFQFDEDGTVAMIIPELIATATTHGWTLESLAMFLCAPTGWLEDNARPVDLLHTDPQAVLAATDKHMAERW